MPNNWIEAVRIARQNLKITGFKAIKKGEPLYIEAKRIHEQLKSGVDPKSLLSGGGDDNNDGDGVQKNNAVGEASTGDKEAATSSTSSSADA